jgi:hypothetical protein
VKNLRVVNVLGKGMQLKTVEREVHQKIGREAHGREVHQKIGREAHEREVHMNTGRKAHWKTVEREAHRETGRRASGATTDGSISGLHSKPGGRS